MRNEDRIAMIRKIIIVVLTLGGLTCVASMWFSLGSFSTGELNVELAGGAIRVSWGAFRMNASELWIRPWFIRVGRSYWFLSVPLWILLLLFATYPTLAFIRGPFRRYRRRKRGLCVTRGYDLRGSPGRCPECGSGTSLP